MCWPVSIFKNKVEGTLGEEIIGKYIDVTRYKDLCDSIPDRKLYITEIISSQVMDEIRTRYLPYLECIEANPAASTLGDEMIFMGSGATNKGYVYYVDIEFGVFKLHD